MEKQVFIVFLQNGESPTLGEFNIGDERNVPENVGRVLISRGVCKKKTSKVKEDKS